MDKETLMGLIQARAKGERARVLFDMLMETLGADFSIKQHEVFERLKEAIEAEQKAIMALMPKPDVHQMPYQMSQEMKDEMIEGMKEAIERANQEEEEDRILERLERQALEERDTNFDVWTGNSPYDGVSLSD